MKRSEFLKITAALAASAALPLNLFAKYRAGTFTAIRRNVGYFTDRGGTIGWLAAPDALVAIDSQFADTAPGCISGLQERTNHPLDMLINTHHHGDHTGGNQVFAEYTDVIAAHKNVPGLQKAAAEKRGPAAVAQQAYANKTFDTRWKQDVGDETVHAFHFGPAHTGGDAVIYFEKANIAHMGDLVFNRAYPFIDSDGGASAVNWPTVLRNTVKELNNDTVYIFGHGNMNYGVTGKKADVQLKADFMEALVDFTRKGIRAGKSKAELMQTRVLKGFEVFDAPGWSFTLANGIDAAYTELTR